MKSRSQKAMRRVAKRAQHQKAKAQAIQLSPALTATWQVAARAVPTGSRGASASRQRRAGRGKTESGYCFVVQVGDDKSWHPVRIDGDRSLSVTRSPEQVFPAVTDELRELWKRVVIDGAIAWDAYNVEPHTMRLMKFEMTAQDCTSDLFQDRDEALHNQRWAGLAKLTEREARVLGLEEQYALMKLFRNPDQTSDDNQLLDDLRAATAVFGFDPKVEV